MDIDSACDMILIQRNRTRRLSIESGLVYDINANLYPSRAGSTPFYMCSFPKTGCSQWIMILHYLLTGEKSATGNVHRFQARKKALLNFSDITSYDTLNDARVPRVLIMRNPYDRVVSAYHDFQKRNAAIEQARNVTFEIFVKNIVSPRPPWQSWNLQPTDHRMPITSGCNTWDHGQKMYRFEWDFVLRLEEMMLWSECLLKKLGLEDITRYGWDTPSGHLFNNGINLYASTDNVELADRTVNQRGWRSARAVQVGHESIGKSGRELFNYDTIDIVNEAFRVDFQVGGYPLWDGAQ